MTRLIPRLVRQAAGSLPTAMSARWSVELPTPRRFARHGEHDIYVPRVTRPGIVEERHELANASNTNADSRAIAYSHPIAFANANSPANPVSNTHTNIITFPFSIPDSYA